MPPEPWDTLLAAWMHDPPDKAADIRTHAGRAARYASVVFGRQVTEAELRMEADQIASAYERLPMPPAAECSVTPENGRLRIVHPLSAEESTIEVACDEAAMSQLLRSLLEPVVDNPKLRFLTLWRWLPERLPEGLRKQPAETRCPDHTLWHHLDTTAAFAWAYQCGGAALLSFKISPVQLFIEAARSLRDLLSGSYLLSALTFAAIVPVLKSCGPTALIYPALRGVPLADHWLKEQGVPFRPEDLERLQDALLRPSIPHRFLALVPNQLISQLLKEVPKAALSRWREIADAVHRRRKQELDADWPDWDRLWNPQIESYFDARAVALPVNQTDPADLLGSEALERFAPLQQLGYSEDLRPGSWQNLVEISTRLMEAATQIPHIPLYRVQGEVPPKCTLLGTYEQMGPSRAAQSRRFFQEGLKFEKATDRLCAVSLVKRFAFSDYFEGKLGVKLDRFPDTRKLARRAGDEFIYYALLAMDGDRIGEWLSGRLSPRLREILHPDLVACHEGHPERREALDRHRPVSPALHAAVSQALTHFAVRLAPRIVHDHDGVLIYCGGDDLLAALPLHKAFCSAKKLRQAFRSRDAMGNCATISAGMAVAHYKDNLREVLRAAREARESAKEAGRNRFALAVLRHSGEHTLACCCWDYLDQLERQYDSFSKGSSDRWSYQLGRQLPVLKALPLDAFRDELFRLLQRSEKRDDAFLADFDRFRLLEQHSPAPRIMEAFLTLCQSVSFMARGKAAQETGGEEKA